ncbi:MAG: electron transport complex subunit RsxE, partial [Bacteroidota bacterium]|nr:electron transport complex subunit RsxE [Bacteroidota bacterium]
FEPWIVMILPPGGFFALGFLLLTFNWALQKRKARSTARTVETERLP